MLAVGPVGEGEKGYVLHLDGPSDSSLTFALVQFDRDVTHAGVTGRRWRVEAYRLVEISDAPAMRCPACNAELVFALSRTAP